MNSTANSVMLHGKRLNLLGAPVQVGAPAPDFTVLDGSFQPVRLSDLRAQVVLLNVVPSLDTPVCAMQTSRFDHLAETMPTDAVWWTISMDLPFAQQRFCQAQKTQRVRLLSDAAHRDFGPRYGLLIDGMGLLARCVMVIGRDGTLTYKELVPELSMEPNYDAAAAALRKALAGA